MNAKRLVILAVGLSLLAGGAGYSDIPLIALLALPVALVGAFMLGKVAFAFKDSQASEARLRLGDAVLVIGTIALLAACFSSVGDVQSHLLSAQRLEMAAKRSLNPAPDLRFLAGWRPTAETLALWVGGPCALYFGMALRRGASKRERFLLLLFWLASAPLSVLVLLFAYLSGEPLGD